MNGQSARRRLSKEHRERHCRPNWKDRQHERHHGDVAYRARDGAPDGTPRAPSLQCPQILEQLKRLDDAVAEETDSQVLKQLWAERKRVHDGAIRLSCL